MACELSSVVCSPCTSNDVDARSRGRSWLGQRERRRVAGSRGESSPVSRLSGLSASERAAVSVVGARAVKWSALEASETQRTPSRLRRRATRIMRHACEGEEMRP